ncbi:MAG: hypothetical protein LDL47_08195 [Cyanobacteria bacterium KgW148]|nr:hypothetical protein [Cyanobacteria bacterium KgW148]
MNRIAIASKMNKELSPSVSPEQVELSLRALRQSYQSLIADFDRCSEYAKLQLSQVELLLSVAPRRGFSEPLPVPSGQVQTKKRGRKSFLKMLPAYDRMTMHEAIATILQKQGGAMDTDTIVYELYGKNLGAEEFKIAKDRVTKSLSKGKQEGKWYRIPDRSGVYTASLEY